MRRTTHGGLELVIPHTTKTESLWRVWCLIARKRCWKLLECIIFAEIWSTERRPRTKLSLPWSANGVVRGDLGLCLILIYLHDVLLHIRVSIVLVYWVVTLFRLDTFTWHLLPLTISLEIVLLKTHPLRYLSYIKWLNIVLVWMWIISERGVQSNKPCCSFRRTLLSIYQSAYCANMGWYRAFHRLVTLDGHQLASDRSLGW